MVQLLERMEQATQILLVVDDRPENLEAMQALLEHGDWQLRCVDGGEAAINIFY